MKKEVDVDDRLVEYLINYLDKNNISKKDRIKYFLERTPMKRTRIYNILKRTNKRPIVLSELKYLLRAIDGLSDEVIDKIIF